MTIFAAEAAAATSTLAEQVAIALARGTVVVLGQSAVAVSGGADTNENILATITVPAGAMQEDGRIRITCSFTVNNNGNAKTVRVRFSGIGGTIYKSASLTLVLSAKFVVEIQNRNSEASQVGSASAASTHSGLEPSTAALVTSAVDTSVATTIVITAQKAVAGDTMTLESYLVELFPRDN